MTRTGSTDAPSVRLASRGFALVSRVLPRRFRQRHQADLNEMFLQVARHAHARGGAPSVSLAALRAAFDVVVRAPAEHRAARSVRRVGTILDGSESFVASLVTDARHAVRALLKSPAYTTVVIATLTLGIDANTAMFGIVNAVLLRPLAFHEPERLVIFHGTQEGVQTDSGTISYLNFIDARERAISVVTAAAYDEWRVNITGTVEPERLEGALVNVEFFDVLGVRPHLGRFFLAEEDVDGNDRVVVLGYGLWQRKFGGEASAVNSVIQLNGNPHVVVGVAPADFEDPLLSGSAWEAPEIWRPLGFFGLPVEDQPSRGSSSYTAIGRLAPRVALSAVGAEMEGIAARLEAAYPDNNSGVGMTLVSLEHGMVGTARPALILLLAAVGLVMAIAAVNVASLVLTRAADRGRDTDCALRSAPPGAVSVNCFWPRPCC